MARATQRCGGTADVDALGMRPLVPLIASLAVPSICANLASSLYTLCDRLFVGNFVGGTALAAVGLIFPLNNVSGAFTVMLGVGGGAALGAAFGAGDRQHASRYYTNIAGMSTIIGAVLGLLFFFAAEPICLMLGALPGTELLSQASLFLRITAAATFFQVINLGLAAVIRAEGNISYSMVVTLTGSGVNIVFNAFAIIVLRLGLVGSATSTLLSSLIGAVLSIWYFASGRSTVSWTGLSSMSVRTMAHVGILGIAPAVFQVLSFFNNTATTRLLMTYGPETYGPTGGDDAIAAWSVVTTVESIAVMFIMGVSNAVSVVLSYNKGARRWRRVRGAALIGQAAATVSSVALWLSWLIVPQAVFALFAGSDDAIIQIGVRAVSEGKLFIFGLGFQTLASMYFSAIGRPRTATFISISRNGLFLIPALLMLPTRWGIDGVFWASSVSDACSMVVVGFIYVREMRRLGRLVKAGPASGLAGGGVLATAEEN